MDEGRDAILDQLAYLVDELEMQRPLLAALPSERLTLTHVGSSDSICDRYLGMLEAEITRHLPEAARLAGLDDVPTVTVTIEPDAETVWLVGELVRVRGLLTGHMARVDPWPDALAEYLYGVVLQDTDALRKVAEQFHEMRS